MAKRKRVGAAAHGEEMHVKTVPNKRTKTLEKHGEATQTKTKIGEERRVDAPKTKAKLGEEKHLRAATKETVNIDGKDSNSVLKKPTQDVEKHIEASPNKKTKTVVDKHSKSLPEKPTEGIKKHIEATSNKKTKAVESPAKPKTTPTTIQIVTGSYDQVLHGMIARIAPDDSIHFADTFLFSAHTSAIRCLAISPVSAPVPGQTQKVFLASGSTDERINIYSLSAHEPPQTSGSAAALASISARPIVENRKNREVGTLLHHGATITALHFPTRSKLLTASEDSTVAVARTRDWAVLSTVRVPKAKAQGRPSGDTAAHGAAPTGVNDFAVHPSLKLMITVSRGERCMRLWNLVTGRKAGVLSFGRDFMHEVGEGRRATGEGRRVVWGSADGSDEFAVGFEREVVAFGMDSVPKCRALGSVQTKVHQICYVAVTDDVSLLAVSTEDGRIVFVSTRADHLERTGNTMAGIKVARRVGHVGGREAGVTGRIKDFAVVHGDGVVYVVGAGSEGTVRVWRVTVDEVVAAADELTGGETRVLGQLMGRYETQSRITCLAAFGMLPRPDGVEESEVDESSSSESANDDSSSDE